MAEEKRLARFTREIAMDGALDRLLDDLAPEHVAPALISLARDRGYALDGHELMRFLAGYDARQR